MATDATGTPTSLGIPKFNTAQDAPSGLGFNAAMDAIDALIASTPRSGAITSLVAHDVPVWNGTQWVRPSGTGSSTTYLRGDGTWATIATTITPATTLPGSPTDGQEAILVDSTTNPSYQLRFRYNASSVSSYKWEYIGGTGISNQVDTAETTSSLTYVALTTALAITLPYGGDWYISHGAQFGLKPTAALGVMSYDIGATGAVDADGVAMRAGSSENNTASRTKKKTGLTAVALTTKYRVSNSTDALTFANRWIRAEPIRVG